MTQEMLASAVQKLRNAPHPNTIRPNLSKVHATCCKGWRVRGEHSPYCFTQREFYVMTLHSDYAAAIRGTA